MSKTYIPVALRKLVAEQSRYRCGYCLTQEEVVGTTMEIDHLLPRALGGPTEEANLWLACGSCNEFKGNRVVGIDPGTEEAVALFNPRRQQWREHFAWSIEGDRIIGLTPTGRATVIVLNLNRPVLVVARRRWATVGWHPPTDSL
jgi:hypothetical protein